MAKTKPLTPQEIYKQRRLREEKEKTAYLPPGLINHGNTCFMNSVLQGLIATRLLSDLVHFNPIPPEIQNTAATPIVSRRSPQLTNGHNLAGAYEQPWVNSMPIGDMFLTVMYKAWDSQAARRRDVLSPRPILSALGQKYDQYLDFAQQDAHEFLRILLDAMRMEEQDIIKKRQPPTHPKTRRRTTITPDSLQTPTNESTTEPPEPPLLSFADMIFGGELTSILVCQKCKHVSQTYEDFNDISLSIKAEDYFPHNRKRDRFKKMVGKLTQFPGSSKPAHLPITSARAVEMLRASSVPPSPRTERNAAELLEEHPRAESPRRRSLDLPVGGAASDPESPVPPPPPTEDIPEVPAQTELPSDTPLGNEVAVESDSNPIVNVIEPEEKHIEFVEDKEKEREKDKDKVSKNEDVGWAKIGRRISLSVGLGRSKGGDKEKDKKERDRKSRSMDRHTLGVPDAVMEDLTAEWAIQKSHSASASFGNTAPIADASTTKSRAVSDGAASFSKTNGSDSANTSTVTIPLAPLPLHKASTAPLTTSVPNSTRSPSPSSQPTVSSSQQVNIHPSSPFYPTSIFPGAQRSKSPKPPKSSSAEIEYLRKILADVSTAPTSSNPFAMFKPPMLHSHTAHHGARATSVSGGILGGEKEKERSAGAAWLGMGRNLTGIEECLRLFTAVEVLDGDNMVGCRRCWKIQNGMLHTSKGKDSDHEDEDEKSQELSRSESPLLQMLLPTEGESGVNGVIDKESSPQKSRPSLSVLTPTPTTLIPTSLSTPTVSFYSSVADTSDTRSVSSLPTEATSVSINESTSSDESPLSLSIISDISDQSKSAGPGGLPIPKISTTAPPETPTQSALPAHLRSLSENDGDPPLTAIPTSNSQPRLARVVYRPNSDSMSKVSLDIPQARTHKRRSLSSDATTTDDNDSSDDESDTSVDTSVSTESNNKKVDGASNGTLKQDAEPAQPSTSQTPLANNTTPSQKKPSKPKPVIMRPAYKRYLIATPPPILVIHLKRFQQTSKSPFMSFSHGFKKLDDYVSFPEYLDLLPFLAPRKEDYGLGKKGKGNEKVKKIKKKEERCMYRLYAVVVHIGNMLGGHYVAYTALPSESPLPAQRPPSEVLDYTPSAAFPSAASSGSSTHSQNHAEHAHVHARKPAERQWAHISDTNVRLTNLEEVLHARAYLCMYERC